MYDGQELLLPPGSVLVHVGPYKTGSTAIQMALHLKREELAAEGVLYPGPTHRQMRPGWSVLGHTPPAYPTAGIDEWDEFATMVRTSDVARVAVSTEDFGRANARQARKIAEDLDLERVHVVAVARRFDNLLPSQWQERIRTCDETKSYEAWLAAVLGEDREEPSARPFWLSHDLIAMIDRWLETVAPERFTLIVSDDSDRELLPRTFERMLGLPPGMLVPPAGENASMSYERAELVRLVNERFDELSWSSPDSRRIVQQAMVKQIALVPNGDQAVAIPELPRWASERVAEISAERVSAIKERGVNLVGDPDQLRTKVDSAAVESPEPPRQIRLDLAAVAIEGAAVGAKRIEAEVAKRTRREVLAKERLRVKEKHRAQADAQAESGGPRVNDLRSRQLAALITRRALGAARHRLSPKNR